MAVAARLALVSLLLAACLPPSSSSSGGTDASAGPDAATCLKPCGSNCCPAELNCNQATKTCDRPCAPSCTGRFCGPDGCGGICGNCLAGTVCAVSSGQCASCTPSCSGKECGDDSCSGQCGNCGGGTCVNNRCVAGTSDGGTQLPDASSGNDAASGNDASAVRPDAGVSGQDAGNGTVGSPIPFTSCPAVPATYSRNFTAAGYCDALARVVCDRYARCCQESSRTYAGCLGEYTRRCVAQTAGSQLDNQARINAGVLALNLASAKACLDSESARQTCTDFGFIASECSTLSLFSPGSPSGGKCFSRIDCTNQRCARPGGACGGTCQPYLLSGATCNLTDLSCDPANLWCRLSGATGTCTATATTGGACTNNSQCFPGDFCNTAVTSTCKTKPTLGQSCLRSDTCTQGRCVGTCVLQGTVNPGGQCLGNGDCVSSSYCAGSTSATYGTCTLFKGPGGACTAAGGECGPAEFCSASNVCVMKGDVGAACTPGTASPQCAYGLFCGNVTSTCVAYKDEGAPCASNGECRFALRCAGALPGTCVATLGSNGSACGIGQQCASGFCLNSVCTATQADGTACTLNNACSSGDCEPAAGSTSSVCRPICTY